MTSFEDVPGSMELVTAEELADRKVEARFGRLLDVFEFRDDWALNNNDG